MKGLITITPLGYFGSIQTRYSLSCKLLQVVLQLIPYADYFYFVTSHQNIVYLLANYKYPYTCLRFVIL